MSRNWFHSSAWSVLWAPQYSPSELRISADPSFRWGRYSLLLCVTVQWNSWRGYPFRTVSATFTIMYMYIYIYICIYTYMYICMSRYQKIEIQWKENNQNKKNKQYIYIHSVYIYIHRCIHIHVYITCIYIYIYIYTHTCSFTTVHGRPCGPHSVLLVSAVTKYRSSASALTLVSVGGGTTIKQAFKLWKFEKLKFESLKV